MTLNFSSFKKSRLIFALLTLCILVFCILAYSYHGRQEGIIGSLLTTIFQYPNPHTTEITSELTQNIAADKVDSTSDPYLEKIKKTYGKYFTESAYQDFINSRIPSKYAIACQEKKLNIKIIDLKITKDKSSSVDAYTFDAELEISDGASKMAAYENGYVGFSENYPVKIDYFQVSDVLLNQLYSGIDSIN